MSECVSLSRPTRVLSVIPVTGAAALTWESNNHKAPPLIGLSQEVTDTLTESTDTLARRAKKRFLSNTSDIRFQISDPSRLSLHVMLVSPRFAILMP